MKKSALFSLLATILFVLSSCGAGAGPADAAKSIVKAMSDGDFEYVVNHMASSESAAFTDAQKEEFKALFESEKIAKSMEKSGKLVSCEVVSEEISEDGNTATVKLKMSYEHESEKTETYKMTKIDNKWYTIMSK